MRETRVGVALFASSLSMVGYKGLIFMRVRWKSCDKALPPHQRMNIADVIFV